MRYRHFSDFRYKKGAGSTQICGVDQIFLWLVFIGKKTTFRRKAFSNSKNFFFRPALIHIGTVSATHRFFTKGEMVACLLPSMLRCYVEQQSNGCLIYRPLACKALPLWERLLPVTRILKI